MLKSKGIFMLLKILLLFTILTSLIYAKQGINIGYEWTVSGDMRNAWVMYDYQNPDGNSLINRGKKDSQGYYFIPKLSLTTPKLYNLTLKTTGAAVTDFGINDPEKEEYTLAFKHSGKSYAILQELYLEYYTQNHHVIVGRNEIHTPLASLDDFYILANSFEIALLEYHPIDELILGGGYFFKMSGNWDSGANGEEFESMSQASYVNSEAKEAAGDSGVGFASIDYNYGNHHFQIWDYYALHLYNSIFTQYNYLLKTSTSEYDFGIQYMRYDGIGRLKAIKEKNNEDNIANSTYSIRVKADYKNGIGFNLGIGGFSDDYGDKETLGAWGGYPFFMGHSFEAGSIRNSFIYKLEAIYNFKNLGKNKLQIKARYSHFALDDKYSRTARGLGVPQDYMGHYRVKVRYEYSDNWYFDGGYRIYKIDNEPDITSVRLFGGYKF